MKVIKKINNNVALCFDNNNHELIAFGNGIGFPKMSYELTDLSKVERTFYGVDANYISMMETLDEGVFQVCIHIVEHARKVLDANLTSNIVFTLADHIGFAIERLRKGIDVKMPLYYDLAHLYKKEVEVGRYALKLVRSELHEYLPDNEVYAVALHFINAQEQPGGRDSYESDKIILQITYIIEGYFEIQLCKEDFNYSRFVSHMQYLLKRKNGNVLAFSDNKKLFQDMKRSFPKIYGCVKDIEKYFKDRLHWSLNEEELLYLMLHINRLCTKEDCNR